MCPIYKFSLVIRNQNTKGAHVDRAGSIDSVPQFFTEHRSQYHGDVTIRISAFLPTVQSVNTMHANF
jgi:hypothetical protein